jgi:hypothetical protein
VKSNLFSRCNTHMGEVVSAKGTSPMNRFIPAMAAALLVTATATPVFAQAAIQEPGLFSFYHPNADVLAGRNAYRAPVDANAYFDVTTPTRNAQARYRSAAPRHYRTAR